MAVGTDEAGNNCFAGRIDPLCPGRYFYSPTCRFNAAVANNQSAIFDGRLAGTVDDAGANPSPHDARSTIGLRTGGEKVENINKKDDSGDASEGKAVFGKETHVTSTDSIIRSLPWFR